MITGFVGNQDSFKHRSSGFLKKPLVGKMQYCENHPTAIWVKGYKQCVQGFQRKEECKKGE